MKSRAAEDLFRTFTFYATFLKLQMENVFQQNEGINQEKEKQKLEKHARAHKEKLNKLPSAH